MSSLSEVHVQTQIATHNTLRTDYPATYCRIIVYGPSGFRTPTYFCIPTDLRVQEILSIRLTQIGMGTQHAPAYWDLLEVESGVTCALLGTIANYVKFDKPSDRYPPRVTQDRVFYVARSERACRIIERLERGNQELQQEHREELLRMKESHQKELAELVGDKEEIADKLDRYIQAQEKRRFDEDTWKGRHWAPKDVDYLQIPCK